MMNSEDEYLEPEQKPEAQLFLPLMGSDIKVLVRMTLDILQCQEQQRREKKKGF